MDKFGEKISKIKISQNFIGRNVVTISENNAYSLSKVNILDTQRISKKNKFLSFANLGSFWRISGNFRSNLNF